MTTWRMPADVYMLPQPAKLLQRPHGSSLKQSAWLSAATLQSLQAKQLQGRSCCPDTAHCVHVDTLKCWVRTAGSQGGRAAGLSGEAREGQRHRQGREGAPCTAASAAALHSTADDRGLAINVPSFVQVACLSAYNSVRCMQQEGTSKSQCSRLTSHVLKPILAPIR